MLQHRALFGVLHQCSPLFTPRRGVYFFFPLCYNSSRKGGITLPAALFTALVSGCFSLIGVLVGAYITEKNARARSAELSRRNAYTEVFNRAMILADASDDASRFSLLAAVYSARLILPKEEPTYQALTKLHKLLLSDSDRAEVGECLQEFWIAAHKECQHSTGKRISECHGSFCR